MLRDRGVFVRARGDVTELAQSREDAKWTDLSLESAGYSVDGYPVTENTDR